MPNESGKALQKGSKLEKIYRWLANDLGAVSGEFYFGPEQARVLAKKFRIEHEPNAWRVLRQLEAKRLITKDKTSGPGFLVKVLGWKADPRKQVKALRRDMVRYMVSRAHLFSPDEKSELVLLLSKIDTIAKSLPRKPRQ